MSNTKKKKMPKYIINGNPIPLSRPRFTKQGRAYDPQKDIKLIMGISVSSQHEGEPLEGPLAMNIVFYFKKHKKPKPYHTYRPDIDNCIKMVLDCCNTIVFKDDAQIVSLSAKKLYDSTPRTEFSIREL